MTMSEFIMRESMKSLVLACVCCLSTVAYGGSYTDFLLFGDSLTDTGNAKDMLGYPVAPYDRGRFSEGPVWADHLANSLALPAPTASRLGGKNFAYGGSQTGMGLSTIPNFAVPNLGQQIADYTSTFGTIAATDLVTVWSGTNDFNAGLDPAITGANIDQHVRDLYNLGGRRFLIGNFAGFDIDPFNDALSGVLPGLRNLEGIEIEVADFESLAQKIFKNPGSYGFTNLSGRICQPCNIAAISDPNLNVETNQIASNPEEFLLWDQIHPSAALHRHIGDMTIESALKLEPFSAGDANRDYLFNSEDLVLTLQGGEYDDGILGNSTWAEGDWNYDLEFDSNDLVAALQIGNYETGQNAAVAIIPEPSQGLWLLIALFFMTMRRRRRI